MFIMRRFGLGAMIFLNVAAGQLKLCLPLGLSQAAVRSRNPFASFHTRRFSLKGSGASGRKRIRLRLLSPIFETS